MWVRAYVLMHRRPAWTPPPCCPRRGPDGGEAPATVSPPRPRLLSETFWYEEPRLEEMAEAKAGAESTREAWDMFPESRAMPGA